MYIGHVIDPFLKVSFRTVAGFGVQFYYGGKFKELTSVYFKNCEATLKRQLEMLWI